MKKFLKVLISSIPFILACNSDNIAPTLTLAGSDGYTVIRVEFSEDVDETTAETSANYALTPDKPSGIEVTAAARDDSDASVVELTLNKAHLPLEYTLTVNNVEDTAGNAIEADSEIAFTGNGKVAFVTTATGQANLSAWTNAGGATGVEAADNVCQAEADAAGLVGTFVAWISIDTSNAVDRLGATSGPWVRTDGHPLAEDLTDFYDGKLLVPLNLDAQETAVTVPYVWTNTNADGSFYGSVYDCFDWTSIVSGGGDNQSAEWGSAFGVAYAWTRLGTYGCGGSSHLYCFQTGAGPVMPSYETTGKIAFITSTEMNGNMGGISGGNSICSTRASAAGLSGTFKAWLSDSTNSAKDNFTSTTGPWVLLNGVKVADDLDDIIDDSLFAPIYLNELLAYEEGTVWTGTLTDGTSATDTCSDWTSSNSGVHGLAGHSPRADEYWTEWDSLSALCSGTRPIYCLEQ